MNTYFLAAGLLTVAMGGVHSLLGERWIFRRLRSDGFIPTRGDPVLREAHVRILWASWHVVTVLGWAFGAVLLWLAEPAQMPLARSVLPVIMTCALLLSSTLVLVGTKGRHPGWIGLAAAAIATFAGIAG
jgi:hypothetical protein